LTPPAKPISRPGSHGGSHGGSQAGPAAPFHLFSGPAHRPVRRALLHSVSATALAIAAPCRPAAAAPFRSLNQALAAHPSAAVAAAQSGGGATAAQAAGLGAQNLARATARFRSLNAALAQSAYSGPAVPDGVAPGGLQQGAGVVASGANSPLWSGASTTLGTRTVNGVHDVTVTQTSGVAALTWKTFNVGARTKLIFNQSAGGTLANTWVAINAIQDPNANPSRILGDISAPGKVYILNRNGILFGAGTQVNVGALIAATADIAAAQFTRDTNGQIASFSLYGSASGTTTTSTFTPTFVNAPADTGITVQAGAAITTAAPAGNATGGYVMLLGGTVENGGIIATPRGQTVLAAGNAFTLQPGYSANGNETATVIGSQIATSITGSITGSGTTALGAVTNSGIVMADQGDISLVGHLVTQAGIVLSTTTVNNRGTVHLLTDRTDTTAGIVLAPNSITEVLPENNGATALNSQRASNLANSAIYNLARVQPLTGPSLNTANTLPDQIGESRIEISTGGSVQVAHGALALAQGGQVAIGGTSIVLDTGATLDVSGTNASLPASFNSLFVQGIVPYYLRDSAANRTGGLEFGNVYVDQRTLQNVSYGGTLYTYTQGGLLELSGNLGLIGHTIGEWSAIAGQVTLQGAGDGGFANGTITTPGTVSVSHGATINLTGGTVTFGAGMVRQSYVETVNNQIYNINTAPGNLVYKGVYTGTVVDHTRWQITDTYTNPLLTPAEIYQPSYTIGRAAGTLTVTAAAGAMNGTVQAGVTTGVDQTAAQPAGVTDPFLLAQAVAPLAGAFQLGNYAGGALNLFAFASNLLISNRPPGGFPPLLTVLPDAATGTISLGAAALSEAGFASMTISVGGTITVAAPLALAAGGSVVLSGASVDAAANITAHGGTIELTNLYPGYTIENPVGSTAGSIAVSARATLDASGQWTNLALDPNSAVGAGFANGGTVTILGTGGVDLAAQSVIDVSSGGVLSTTGKLTAEAGGSIGVSADIVPTLLATLQLEPAIFAARLLGYASGAGGTLSLSAPYMVVGAPPPQGGDLTVTLDPAQFASGFADYVLNGYLGTAVTPHEHIGVTRPVYVLANADIRSGQAAAAALAPVLNPLYTPAGGNDTILQRAGASIALLSSIDPTQPAGGGGIVTIGQGAGITVDPGQSITLEGYGEVTDYGTLTAHGGTITVANTRYEVSKGEEVNNIPANYANGLSVWIAPQAVLDASGQAVVFTDALGRRFGRPQSGGAIFLGGLGGQSATSTISTYAQVIVRPGAELNVSGAAATVDVSPGLTTGPLVKYHGPVTLAGNGGLIAARSYSGVALDGTLLAHGQGRGSAGGTLAMRLDAQDLKRLSGIPQSYIQPSQILISQNPVAVQAASGLIPGAAFDSATISLGRVSQAQLTGGGFDTLFLYAQNDIAFAGNVTLKLGRSIALDSGIIGDTMGNAQAQIVAPYVSLAGYAPGANGPSDLAGNGQVQTAADTSGALTISAAMVDIANSINIGGVAVLPAASAATGGTAGGAAGGIAPHTASAYGFAETFIGSSGDIRFNAGYSGSGTLAASGNIVFRAAQLYPTTSSPTVFTSDTVIAGLDPYNLTNINQLAGGTLTVLGLNQAAPAAPASVGGTLSLFAGTVVQDGVVRAPEGEVQLGKPRSSGTSNLQLTDSVVLGPRSITSVSLDGQTVPYGGTVDGVNYLYNGQPVAIFNPVVAIGSVDLTAARGASIDLSGGGTLAGAGFIAGRGGSADVNVTPLLNTGTGTVTASGPNIGLGTGPGTDPVFAILPGYASSYAPVAPGDAAYSTPTPGERIAIAAGEVPGLAAGTYTLLPAYYDLLPGGYRVELTAATVPPGSSQSFGNFTTVAAVTLGTANTAVAASVPTAALITSGAGVRQLAQYNTESYNNFEITSAATFGAPRPLLPQDAKTLQVTLNSPTGTISADSALALNPGLLDQAPARNGYGATMVLTAIGNADGPAAIEVLAPGQLGTQLPSSSGTGTTPTLAVAADTLSALDVPRLVIGGTLSTTTAIPNEISFVGAAAAVVIEPHAALGAGDVLLVAESGGGSIVVSSGATISTIGQPASAYGVAQGYYFNSDKSGTSSPLLEISNNQAVYTPSASLAAGAAITIGAGATLDTTGSLNFVAPAGASVQVGQADLVAKYVTLQVADINIGSQADLTNFAAALPAGLTLTDAGFNTLAANAAQLILTAQQSINIIGDVQLVSPTARLVLNTPAIYGYGTAVNGAAQQPGLVQITAPAVTWAGVPVSETLQTGNAATVSATPGGRLGGSVVDNGLTYSLTNADALVIGAQTIDLGYGPNAQANDQVLLDRLALGFNTVELRASKDITANAQSALAVYASQAQFGQPGTGGNLVLATPLVTAASGAVLHLTAGGTLTASSAAPAATGGIATLGAQIDLVAGTVDIGTAFALPSGELSIAAQSGIDLAAGSMIDLSGRDTALFDKTAASRGGTLLLQAYAGDAGGIAQQAGAKIDVGAPNAAAGSISAIASGGSVSFGGTLQGQGGGGHAGGSFTVFAATLGAGFAALNQALDTGGFTGLRGIELATGNITVAAGQTIAAHVIDLAADTGSVTIDGTLNASGHTPGSIALSAGGNLAIGGAALLDAHATATATDSYGVPINAENRAHVTLTSAGGTVTLQPGAAINLSYPAAAGNPQGQLVIDAPRLAAGGALADVAAQATGPVNITGAATLDLFAFRTYSPTNGTGTIVQDNGTGTGAGYQDTNAGGTLGLVQIGLDNAAFMQSVNADGAALASQLAGLAHYGSTFNVEPGVAIVSTAATNNNLTISGDLNFSGLRYSDPVRYFGTAVASANGTVIVGSGEPGAIAFRASNDLIINGSVTDGFLPPPDAAPGSALPADLNGWAFITGKAGGYDPTNADILLPAGSVAVASNGGTGTVWLVGAAPPAKGPAPPTTVFDTSRPIALNYAITINPANLRTGIAIPFTVYVGATSSPVPAGGWIATANVVRAGAVIYQAGQRIPAGFAFLRGDELGAGFVLPVSVSTIAAGTKVNGVAVSQVIPAGTSFGVFATTSPTISLAVSVALPANAFIPSFTKALFGGCFVKGRACKVAQVTDVTEVAYRPLPSARNPVQGYLYPLAQMTQAGTRSWSLDFTAGANLGAAAAQAVQASSSLQQGVFAPPAAAPDAAPGSLLIDDPHYYAGKTTAFSVIRTGTGDLALTAGGNVDQSSLFGIYTAGTQDPLAAGNSQFDSARQAHGPKGQLLPGTVTLSTLIQNSYQAYYPNNGGDLLLAAQGNVTSDIYGDSNGSSGAAPTDVVGNWLWRQGSTQLGQPTAWWINFGTLVAPLGQQGTVSGPGVQMTGFTGFGALGGGNVTVNIGGDAGQQTARDVAGIGVPSGPTTARGEGLVIAVGATGRLLPGTSTPVTTGGGDVTVTIGGTLNPLDAAAYGIGAVGGSSNGLNRELSSVNGDLIDVRGNIVLSAGAVGRIDLRYDTGTAIAFDPRAANPFAFNNGVPNGGIQVLPGDGTVSIVTARDLVLADAADPGRVAVQNVTSIASSLLGTNTSQGGLSGFTLWQSDTAVSLFSAGGNVTPTTVPNQQFESVAQNNAPTDYRSVYPATLLVTAATGDIIYGQDGATPGSENPSTPNYTQYSLETAPAPTGQVAFLAGGSIIANGYAVDISGANPALLSRITDPAFTSDGGSPTTALTNIRPGIGTVQSPLALFAEQTDTPTTATPVHANDTAPALFYAAGGDIVNFQSGETIYFGNNTNEPQSTWYIAGKPVWIVASNDIVSSGTRPDAYPNATVFASQENQQSESFTTPSGPTPLFYSSGNLFYNTGPYALSLIQAGRDILSTYAYVAGPGTLDVNAGRDLYQAAYSAGANQVLFFGSIKSIGNNIVTGSPFSSSDGAGINIQAGVGANGPDFTAFANLYFDPATQYSFTGSFPTPGIPAGGTTYAYGGKVQFNYAVALSYDQIQTALAAFANGQPAFAKPPGATSGGSGVTVPAGLLSLLKSIQASTNPLPAGQPFSFLQIMLRAYAGYTGNAADAPATYFALPAGTRDAIAQAAYYMELQASGSDHGQAASTFFNSYVRGQEAIDTLFPSLAPEQKAGQAAQYGVPAGYNGAITMYSGTVSAGGKTIATDTGAAATFDGGVATLYGGNVQVLDPGGAALFGITGGPAPGNSSGIVTYGSGDVNIYSLGSVLLGQSRIFTTGGGNIVIWSSSGDINAGIGAKTTQVYTPPLLVYDNLGDVTETPPASASGAGIATLQPLPGLAAGNVNLIAPGGSIDAGEAGIRVSGNLVLAAARVIGTANIAVKGSTSGAPTTAVASLGAVEAAGAAAGAATSTAQTQGNRNDTASAASIIDVEVVSVGGTYGDDRKKKRGL
jgi:filamentous hemagglutinin family protein